MYSKRNENKSGFGKKKLGEPNFLQFFYESNVFKGNIPLTIFVVHHYYNLL